MKKTKKNRSHTKIKSRVHIGRNEDYRFCIVIISPVKLVAVPKKLYMCISYVIGKAQRCVIDGISDYDTLLFSETKSVLENLAKRRMESKDDKQ